MAQALMETVFLGMALFPTVLRSDNAKEFTGAVIQYMNAALDIKHILGSTYHPQSQGVDAPAKDF